MESEDLKKIRKEYEKIRRKHLLPNFDKIDQEFEIRRTFSDGFIVSETRRAAINKLQDYIQLLDPVLNPHPGSLHSMIEADGFDEEDKKKLFDLYKKLGFLIHQGILAGLKNEKDQVTFIKDCWKKWPTLKKDITEFVTKAAIQWSTNDFKIDEAEYMG